MANLFDFLVHIVLIGTWCTMVTLTVGCADHSRQPAVDDDAQAEVVYCPPGSTNVKCPNPYR